MSVTITSIVEVLALADERVGAAEPDVQVGGVDEQVGRAGDHLAVDVLHGGVGPHRDRQPVEVGVEVADAQVEVVGAGGVGAAGERLDLPPSSPGRSTAADSNADARPRTNTSLDHHGVQRPKSKRSQPGGA